MDPALVTKLLKQAEDMRAAVASTPIWAQVLQFLNLDHVEESHDGSQSSLMSLVCYGLGNFSEHETPLHQLGMALLLQGLISGQAAIYDPVFTQVRSLN